MSLRMMQADQRKVHLLLLGPDLEKGWYGTAAVAAVGTGTENAARPGLAARLARLRGISNFG